MIPFFIGLMYGYARLLLSVICDISNTSRSLKEGRKKAKVHWNSLVGYKLTRNQHELELNIAKDLCNLPEQLKASLRFVMFVLLSFLCSVLKTVNCLFDFSTIILSVPVILRHEFCLSIILTIVLHHMRI